MKNYLNLLLSISIGIVGPYLGLFVGLTFKANTTVTAVLSIISGVYFLFLSFKLNKHFSKLIEEENEKNDRK